MDNIVIKNLAHLQVEPISELLCESYSKYFNDFCQSVEELERKFIRAGVDLTRSFGAFDGDKLIGVAINAVDYVYAFDFVTAVHPDYRRQKIAIRLFEESVNAFSRDNLLVYKLEISSNNENGLLMYRKLGMKQIRTMSTYSGNLYKYKNQKSSAKCESLEKFDLKKLPQDFDNNPSWENSSRILNKIPELYEIYYINYPMSSKIAGYAIIEKESQIIRQFYVENIFLKKYLAHELLIALSDQYTRVEIQNIDSEYVWVHHFLNKHEFVKVNDTYEFEKILNSRSEIMEDAN